MMTQLRSHVLNQQELCKETQVMLYLLDNLETDCSVKVLRIIMGVQLEDLWEKRIRNYRIRYDLTSQFNVHIAQEYGANSMRL